MSNMRNGKPVLKTSAAGDHYCVQKNTRFNETVTSMSSARRSGDFYCCRYCCLSSIMEVETHRTGLNHSIIVTRLANFISA
jgi:hypothetical protein